MSSLLSGQLLVAALATGGLYALVAVGLNLVYGTMRLLNVAHGEFVMVGAYVAFLLFSTWQIGPPWSLLAAFAVATALGLAAYRGLFHRLLERNQRVEANSLLLFFRRVGDPAERRGADVSANERAYRHLDGIVTFGDVSVTESRLLALVVSLAVCLAVALALRYAAVGQAIRAVLQNRDAAALVGVNVVQVQRLCFAFGVGAAGMAGALISLTQGISPFMGFPFTIAAFVVVILGGLGNLTGSLVGGLLLGFLETYGIALTAASYRSILLYGVFVGVLILLPRGLFGRRAARR